MNAYVECLSCGWSTNIGLNVDDIKQCKGNFMIPSKLEDLPSRYFLPSTEDMDIIQQHHLDTGVSGVFEKHFGHSSYTVLLEDGTTYDLEATSYLLRFTETNDPLREGRIKPSTHERE